MSLRQKIKNHFKSRSGQGSLVGVIVATVMLSMICAAGTEWYLSMRKNIGNTEEKLEAQTIAMSEWERLSHMSLDELEASRDALKKPYAAGQFTVSVNLGQKGTFNNGTCGAVTGGYANCFKDTTITVSRDGSRLFTTRTLPLMAGDYTRREIDNLLAGIRNDYNNKINAEATARANKDTDLQNQINALNTKFGSYYTKSEVDTKVNNSGACKITSASSITERNSCSDCGSDTSYTVTFSCPSGFTYNTVRNGFTTSSITKTSITFSGMFAW